MLRIGAVCSSGGAVLVAAHSILKSCGHDIHISVATDRPCGVETAPIQKNWVCRRFDDADSKSFSARVADWLYCEQAVSFVFLFFARLVGEALFGRGSCINLHPSLLPLFPGFGALKAAFDRKEKIFGATAHLVDQTVDSGPILAQVLAILPPAATLPQMERVSFAQKVYLTLAVTEMFLKEKTEKQGPFPELSPMVFWDGCCNPAIRSEQLRHGFQQFVERENIPWRGGIS